MRAKLVVVSVLLVGLLTSLAAIRTQAQAPAENPNDNTAADQSTLRNAGVATDAAGLVAYFRKLVLSDADREKIETLVQQLGSDKFAAREEASEKLVALGQPAVSFLRIATRNSNREVAQRAETCLSEIETPPDPAVPAAAVRLLTHRPNGDALKVLIDYFPFAGDEGVEEEVLTALGALGVKQGKVDPILHTALKDALPARRGAAASVLAKLGDVEQRAIVRPMLADPDARVRYYVGRGLLGDRFPKPETPLSVEDKKFLKSSNVGSDAAGLVAFFKRRTLSEEDRKNLEKMVTQLDSNMFALRQEASTRLVEIGTPALPFLRNAAVGNSLEMTRRVEECIRQIERGPGPTLPAAAARLLAQRAPADAIKILVDYAPFADDATVEDEVITALGILSLQDPKVPQALVATLKDDLPARRAVASLVLGQVGEKEQVEAVRDMIKDADARVRYRAAQGLMAAKDKGSVPVLLALLADGPLPQAGQAEALLQNIGGEKAPTLSISDTAEDGRKKAAEAWAAWWRDHGDKIDLSAPDTGRPHLGLTIVAELPGNANSNRVWEFGPDGKERWQMGNLLNPIDAQVIKGNRVLVAEHGARKVTERDMSGKVVWEKAINGNPVSCQRLANGNTFIAHYQGVLEVTPAGKEIYNHANINNGRGIIYDGVKLANGNFAFISGVGTLVEMDPSGKQIRSIQVGQNINWGGLEALPGNRFLVALSNPGTVKEVDANGKTVWEAQVPGASHATRLPNGNTIVACMNNQKLVEINKAGKTVWEKTTSGRPFHVHRR